MISWPLFGEFLDCGRRLRQAIVSGEDATAIIDEQHVILGKWEMYSSRLPKWPDRDKIAQDGYWCVNFHQRLPWWRRIWRMLRG